jgi:hypothetical protein
MKFTRNTMIKNEPKRYFSNIVGPPTNEQHYSETSYGKIEIKIKNIWINLKEKLTNRRNDDK